jgi:DNA (cytosine-5)-methyltransferase 1
MKVGTDCSGIEAPIQALRNLNIPFEHVFSCENNRQALLSLTANFTPVTIYKDILKRDHTQLPQLDFYICGFPCQPFSKVGKRKGFEDLRGMIFFECVETIKITNPKVFVLENVREILKEQIIFTTLKNLDKYTVVYSLLNTRDYGIPQNRVRVFFVGIRKDVQTSEFKFPEKLPCKNILSFVDLTDESKDKLEERLEKNKALERLPPNSVFVDLCFIYKNQPNADKWCSCLLKGGRIWCVPKHRLANSKELLSLQGFPQNFKQVVSNSQLRQQLGNSISVNVLEELFKCIFSCVSL